MKKIFERIDPQFKSYQFYGYPITNFGVLSVSSSSNNLFDDQRKLCSTFKCLKREIPNIAKEKLEIDKQYVDSGGYGSPLTFISEEERKFFLKAALPAIQSLLGVDFSLSNNTKVKVNLTAARVYKRSMHKLDFIEYLKGIKASNDPTQAGMYELLRQNRFCAVIGDVAVDEMDVEIIVDKDTGTDIKVKLDGKVAETVGKGAEVGAKFSRSLDFTYKVSIREPMVLAIFPLNIRSWKVPLPKW